MRTASAIEGGLSPYDLRTRLWHHPHHGVVVPAGIDDSSPAQRIRQAAPLMTPSTVMTGWAAAHLQGLWIFDGLDRRGQPIPVMLASPDAGRHRPREGIRPTRRYIRKDERFEFDGMNVATIARAAYDMALDSLNLVESVVCLDMCVSTVIPQGRTSLANIEDLVARHKKTRGIRQVREALSWVSTRSASPWETRTRLLATREAGIENLLANVPVFDTDGNLLGVADLFDPKCAMAIEFDGDHHRDRDTHAQDNRREEKYERAGVIVCRVTGSDHRHRSETIHRLRAAHRDARMRRRQEWTLTKPPWWSSWAPGRRWD